MQGRYSIDGCGKINGGDFEELSIDGSGKVEGDIKAGRLIINGSGKIEGKLIAGKLNVDGAAKFIGDADVEKAEVDGSAKFMKILKAEKLEVNGGVKTEEDITAGDINVSGGLSCGGSISTQSINVSGILKCSGDVEAETVKGDGLFSIKGTLNGESIELNLKASSEIENIGGHEIKICKSSNKAYIFDTVKDMFKLIKGYNGLKCSQIEGDDISIEHTKADNVKGITVLIGEGCEVGRVEYSKSLTVAPGSKVGEKVKVEIKEME